LPDFVFIIPPQRLLQTAHSNHSGNNLSSSDTAMQDRAEEENQFRCIFRSPKAHLQMGWIHAAGAFLLDSNRFKFSRRLMKKECLQMDCHSIRVASVVLPAREFPVSSKSGKGTMETRITRRTLGKLIAAAGTAAGVEGVLSAELPTDAAQRSEWKEVHPGVWRATLGSPERYTLVSSRRVEPHLQSFKELPRVDTAPLSSIAGQRIPRGFVVNLPLRAGEQVYGFGLQFLSFAQRGKKKVARVNADPRVDTGDSHAPVPFYVTTEGIGILVDTARYASFYFGDARPKPTHSVASVAQSNPAPNDAPNLQIEDDGLITVDIPRAAGVDIYLFAGPTMLDAVKRYNVFSGGGVMPPEWGLGFWYRMDAQATQQSALALAAEFRDHKIPCDVLGLEPGWQTHAYSCTFEWNKERFPDPAGFVHSAGQMNYKINLWEHAFTHPASPLFPALERYSGNYGVWGGLVPDFASAPGRETFGAYHGKTFVDAGISGFKLDECDNSDYTGGWSFPECSSFPSGIDGEQMHSVFGLNYQMAIWDEFRKRGLQTFNLVRSSGALAAPYPFVLYSDLYGHREFIRALANSGFCGLLWCPEVRDAVNEEDLIRRLESVVFSPLAMVNGWYIKSPPWMQLNRKLNNAGQLLDNWQQLEARCREIVGWRMQLVPYLKAAFEAYAENGTPPFRALVLDTPKDQRLHNIDDQYMVGDRMMVAPLFAGEAGRSVVLPQGQWHDFWTGKSVGGGIELNVPATARRIPVYVRSGSILPLAEVGLHTGAAETRRLTAHVYGDGSLPFTVRDGNGTLQLSWVNGRGQVDGKANYKIVAWKQMG
jgi:alpha-D-xyloside xylohydrolase